MMNFFLYNLNFIKEIVINIFTIELFSFLYFKKFIWSKFHYILTLLETIHFPNKVGLKMNLNRYYHPYYRIWLHFFQARKSEFKFKFILNYFFLQPRSIFGRIRINISLMACLVLTTIVLLAAKVLNQPSRIKVKVFISWTKVKEK